MRCRNRLWRPEIKSRKHPEKQRGGDVTIYRRDGTTEIIPITKLSLNPDIPFSPARKTHAYTTWKSAVRKRDHSTCVLCASQVFIHVHHIRRWIDDEAKRYDVDNGVCLCAPCHYKNHGPQMQPFPADITEILTIYVEGLHD